MEDDARSTERQPTSLLVCPRCGGTGRVGEGREPCRACWCAGVVEAWRAEKLIDEDARRNGVARRPVVVETPARIRPAEPSGAPGPSRPSGPPDPHQGSGLDADSHARRAGLVEACVKCAPVERCSQCPFGPFVLAA